MDKKFTKDFIADLLEDLPDYYIKYPKSKNNVLIFSESMKNELDFDLVKKELAKNNYLLNFNEDKQWWKISKK